MAKIHTHYDNLEVPRNASPEVIHTAYRELLQKFHPDKILENSEASRTLEIINTSYKVLSDPDKRRKYDKWISKLEAPHLVNKQTNQALHTTIHHSDHAFGSTTFLKPFPSKFAFIKLFFIWAFFYIIGVCILLGAVWLIDSAGKLFEGKSGLPPHGPKAHQYSSVPVRLEYIKPKLS
jgi:curved DNA-binding protein CbpA